METLLAKHWPTLHAQGLVTDARAAVYRGLPTAGPGEGPDAVGDAGDARATEYAEVFSWVSPDAPGTAHQLPEVLAVWEPMGALCEQMDFPHFEALELPR